MVLMNRKVFEGLPKSAQDVIIKYSGVKADGMRVGPKPRVKTLYPFARRPWARDVFPARPQSPDYDQCLLHGKVQCRPEPECLRLSRLDEQRKFQPT